MQEGRREFAGTLSKSRRRYVPSGFFHMLHRGRGPAKVHSYLAVKRRLPLYRHALCIFIGEILGRRLAGILMENLGEVGGTFISHAGGNLPQEHVGLLLQDAYGGVHAATGQVGVEGGSP